MNILVVELNKYHTETLPVYNAFLNSIFEKNDINIEYVVNPHKYSEAFNRFEKVSQVISKIGFFFIFHLQLRTIFYKFKLQRIIKKNKIDAVVFNTIEPKRHYKVFKSLKVDKKIGVIHNIGEIDVKKSLDEKYFLMVDYAFENLKDRYDYLDGYFLAVFPNLEFKHKKASRDFVQISISGHVDFKKRNFSQLIEVCQKLKEKKVNNIKFNIVSSVDGAGEGRKLVELAKENQLEEFFIFHSYLDDEDFFKNIYESDFVLPLVNTENKQFLYDRLTASYSMACSYKKVMILEDSVRSGWNLSSESVLSYKNTEELVDTLIHLSDGMFSSIQEKFIKEIDFKISENKKLLQSIKFD
ncbi:MAG: hypothetical protein OIF32_10220 [Campylobacterales bacterium]|nr:hypothetical protein [Campylobacterales bacterium]